MRIESGRPMPFTGVSDSEAEEDFTSRRLHVLFRFKPPTRVQIADHRNARQRIGCSMSDRHTEKQQGKLNRTPSSELRIPDSRFPQEAIIQFLRQPGSYPHAVESVEVRQTHGSWVFLAGPRAYKLKKAVDLGFFDYSTLEKRRHYCEEEVRLNRRLAPKVYIGVRSVREDHGKLRLANPGDVSGTEVDCVVEMERLADAVLLDRRLEAGAVTSADLERLVEVLARFYREAARGPEIDHFGEPAQIRRNVLENFEQTRSYVGDTLDRLRFEAIRSAQLSFLSLNVDLLAQRVADGWIRDGHGDLRAEHVAFVPEPIVIDCIEFADRFRYGDVASDLAFLVMDLEFLGHAEHAATLSRLYERVSGDRSFTEVIDFYASYRAYVRGKVDGMKLRQGQMDAKGREDLERRVKRHFELAHYHTLGFHEPLCILVGGLSGMGKSTLARALATELGASLVRSDEVRKELVGLPPSSRVPSRRAGARFEEGIYSREVTQATYEALRGRADFRAENDCTMITASINLVQHSMEE